MNFYETSQKIAKPSYTGIVLDQNSRKILIDNLNSQGIQIDPSWELIAHHCTVNLGSFKDGPAFTPSTFKTFLGKVTGFPKVQWLGRKVSMIVNTVASNDLVIAVGVTTSVPSTNETKHITIAVNRAAGGKPYMSNLLANWKNIVPFTIFGTLEEVK